MNSTMTSSREASPLLKGSLKRAMPAGVLVPACVLISTCGTSDPNSPGRCTTSDPSGHVAAATDTTGEEWNFSVSPSSYSVQCRVRGASGVLQLVGIVRDAQKLPISSVAVGASVPEFGGLQLVTEANIAEVLEKFNNFSGSKQRIVASDSFTDNCGVALFTLVFTCPSEPGLGVGGDFVAYSGPLFSEPVGISVTLESDNEEEDDTTDIPDTTNPALTGESSTPRVPAPN